MPGFVALGFIGALLGTWLARALGLPELLAFGGRNDAQLFGRLSDWRCLLRDRLNRVAGEAVKVRGTDFSL
jgi:hypothetical protein